ncbi:MAG TPA: hypothetical protein VGG69_12270 [Rhizomicrobium sp.]
MKVAERVLGALLIVGALVTGTYWWSYFTGGDVMVLHERWYTAFESSFPVADGWMALCMLVSGIGFALRRNFAAPFGLMAGSALLYLAAMDITFDVENGMYEMARTDDAMKFEAFINVTTVALAVMTLIVSWGRLRPPHTSSTGA